MPNIDSGHYFLTSLIPVMLRSEIAADGVVAAPVNRLREILALLQTGGDPVAANCSPFARNTLNHFVRFVVIEDVNFNGRRQGDAIVEATLGPDPSLPQPVDHLSRPYLLFAAEFDVNLHGAAEPDVYLDMLWRTMKDELVDILKHCYGFSAVESAGDFVRYIRRCQVETTLPFCDYWTTSPPFKTFPFAEAALGCIAAGAIAGIAIFAALDAVAGRLIGTVAAVLGFFAVAISMYIWQIGRQAAEPFPAAPDSDLKSVLKALYLQRAFVDFVIATQGASPQALHAKFAAFLAQHQPAADAPTQLPGVIGA